MVNNAFHTLFSRRELTEIKGVRNRNYVILIAILAGTFAAVTFADGGLDYLRYKMSDPFVQNLEIKVPVEKAKEVGQYKFILNQDSLQKKFGFDTVMAHVELSLMFWQEGVGEFRRVKGRSIEPENPILEQIFHRSNLLLGRKFMDAFDCGLVVTEKVLREMGYATDTHFLGMRIPKSDGQHHIAPVPVIAVVKELPGLAGFAFTPYFYKVRNFYSFDNPFNLEKYKEINLYYPGRDTGAVEAVRTALREILQEDEQMRVLDPYVETMDYDLTYQPGTLFTISFYPAPPTKASLDLYASALLTNKKLSAYADQIERTYYYDFPMFPPGTISYDRMSVMFSTLKHVRSFNEYIYGKFEFEVEMSKIKDKENFVAISILTTTMAMMLLLFSVFSISVFVFNLLRSHLLKIRMNLGTFKAFGLSNSAIEAVYRKIIRKFFFSSLGVAFAVIFVVDQVVVGFVLREISALHIFNIYLLTAIVAIIVSVELTVKSISERILRNTPGDLIYGRDKS
jgi:hypothetical protein